MSDCLMVEYLNSVAQQQLVGTSLAGSEPTRTKVPFLTKTNPLLKGIKGEHKMTIFIGPVSTTGGPGIKNRLLLRYIKGGSQFRIYNTSDRSIVTFLKTVLALLLTRDKQVIVSVSKNGRAILYPILHFKKLLHPSMKYSLVCIGGLIALEAMSSRRIKLALKNCDLATVETKALQTELVSKLHLDNTFYMPNYKEMSVRTGLTLPEFHDRHLRFVFLSRVCNSKGIRTLISAFKEILARHPEAILDVYGPIEDDDLDPDILEEIAAHSSIHYMGTVLNRDVVSVLSDYHVFVFPSEYKGEGFPAVIIEAYMAGLVVVASDINYNAEIVAENRNGWTFEFGSKAELTDALLRCFDSADTLVEISRYNYLDAKRYSVETIVQGYAAKLQENGWLL